MADIQTQMPVKLTDNTNTAGITAGSALRIDGSAVTQPVSGTITSSPTGTYTVAGTVNSTPTGTYTVAGTVTNVPSGTQAVSGTVTSTPTGTYTVTAASMTVVNPTAANLKAQVVGAGTAGTADAGVVTIQGIASMTPISVSGTTTATPTGTYTVAGTVNSTPTGTYTVAGTVTNVPSGTQPVSGTVTATPTGTYTVTATSMTVVNPTAANLKAQVVGAGTAGTADAGVLTIQGIASMTPISVSGTTTATPTGTYTVAGTVNATPTGTYTVAGTVTSVSSGTQPVSGTVTAVPSGTYTVTATSMTVVNPTAANLKAQVVGAGTAGTADAGVLTIQGIASMTPISVSGTTTATPTGTYTVAGTVNATPTGTYTVAGTVTNVPSGTQPVSGTVTAVPSGTYTVTATSMTVVQSTAANLKAEIVGAGTAGTANAGVLSVQGINNATPLNVSHLAQTGIVVNYQTQASLANASTATLSYTVTAGRTLYLKGIMASSSGAPCRVQVDYGAGPTVAAVGFYSASMPFLAINFTQPPAITASTVVNIKIQNNAGAAQDVYCTLMGEERV